MFDRSRSPVRRVAEPLAGALARVFEASPVALGALRTFPLPGKRLVVRCLRDEVLPAEVTADCDGITYRLHLDDVVERKIYFRAYERAERRLLGRLVPSGDGVCMDVGAHVGYFALTLASRLGPDGVVHAIEPHPANFARLTENCRLNPFGLKVQAHRLAVSNRNGQAELFQHSPTPGGPYGSLVNFGQQATASERVQTITLDTFVAQEGIERVDLLKMDVEAHEPDVIEGAAAALDAKVFRRILIEFNGGRLLERQTTLQDFLGAFAAHGYTPSEFNLGLLRLMQGGVLRPERVCTNLVFTPTEGR